MYKIEHTTEAVNNFKNVFDYIANYSLHNAITYTENLKVRISRLAEAPRLGKLNTSETDRILIVDKYKVYYSIIEYKQEIIIRYIKHEKQK